MKRSLLLLIFFILTILKGQSQTSPPVKISFDGYYRTLPDSLNPFSYYLRFYADGAVIGYSTAGNPKNLVAWFNKDHKSPLKGQYILKDSTLSFSLKGEDGTVLYDGVIRPGNSIAFNVKSLINKYQGKEEYFFLKMEGLK